MREEVTPVFVITPEVKWRWDVFGEGLLLVDLTRDVSWWTRWKTSFFLGSKWERINDKNISNH